MGGNYAGLIDWLELESVFRGLRVFVDLIRISSVLVRTDNSTVVSYYPSELDTVPVALPLHLCTWDVMMWCMQSGVTI